MNEDWKQDASCATVGGDGWFPDNGNVNQRILNICAACPARKACLEYALSMPVTEDIGIWGGTSVMERRRMRKERAA